jgi:hypothetical protein
MGTFGVVDLEEILYGGDDVEDDVDSTLRYIIPWLQPLQNGGRLNA